MKALVLGGGSLKGSWQVGAIKAVFESGFKPDMIYGISAGALNASYLVNQSGKQYLQNGTIDWNAANEKLIGFWQENITKPNDIGILKSKISLSIDTILSRFDGLLDTNPLHEKLKKHLDLETIRKSPTALKVGAVNINTSLMHYADPSEEYFLDYLRASSSIPLIMPGIPIGGDYKNVYLDGGLREVVPIKKAIEDGAKEIFVISTHPKIHELKPFNYRSFFSLIERIKDISVNQLENNDIEWAETYKMAYTRRHPLKKRLKLTIIRPETPIEIALTEFDTKDIERMIEEGYARAKAKI